jgi:hypothetical protein
MDSAVYKYLKDWGNLIKKEEKKNVIYKREILLEKYKEKKQTFEGDDIILPLARRVAATTLGQELVSVQPLPQPTGLLFYIDYDGLEKENVYKRNVLVEKMKRVKGIVRRSRRRANRRTPINFEVIDNANGRYIR